MHDTKQANPKWRSCRGHSNPSVQEKKLEDRRVGRSAAPFQLAAFPNGSLQTGHRKLEWGQITNTACGTSTEHAEESTSEQDLTPDKNKENQETV